MTFILAADQAGMIWKRITPERFKSEEYCADADPRDPRSMAIETAEQLADVWYMASRAEVGCIRALAANLKSGDQAMIIGAAVGTLSMAILREAPKEFHLWSVDIDPVNHESAFLSNAGLWDHKRITKLWGDSREIGKWWARPLDLLVIDGDHTYAGVSADLAVWADHVITGGIMVCHDYIDSDHPGLQAKPAINDWFERGQPFEKLPSPESLMVLRRQI